MILTPPPTLADLPYGYQLVAGRGRSIIIADFDFETYSPAGFAWDDKTETWKPLPGAREKGLPAIGAAKYSEDPGAEVLSLAYNLKNGQGIRVWTPESVDHPQDLFDHLASGKLIEAWNAPFEMWIWKNICVTRYGFPPLPTSQIRCAAAKARAFCLPGGLKAAGDALSIEAKKLEDGKRLLAKFSVPQKPSKKQPEKRIRLTDPAHQEDAKLLLEYNKRDIEAEAEISSHIPDLSDFELSFWQCDLAINQRGAYVDLKSAEACVEIIRQAYDKYSAEIHHLTGGAVTSVTQLPKLKLWLNEQGLNIYGLDADTLDLLLKKPLPENVKRVLEIRSLAGSSAIKKLYSMINRASRENRLHDMFVYHKARTGRAAGEGPQPQNMPNSGPMVYRCENCQRHCLPHAQKVCMWCTHPLSKKVEWCYEAAEDALSVIRSKNLDFLELFFDDSIATVYGCLRSLICAAPDHDLICSDFSAIEAVVLAMLSGEQWRIDIFKTHGKIYEASASKITGVSLEDMFEYKNKTGQHHPLRKLGKVAELASGYQGGPKAWVRFGAEDHLSESEIKKNVYAWRDASPMITRLWTEIEHAAKQAIRNPRTVFSYRGISYQTTGNALYCQLPSGRFLTYHKPRIIAGQWGDQIEFYGTNSNPIYGAIGWVPMVTYGGKLVENIVQAVARDILAYAIVNLEKSGYKVVLHVHDEIVAEVREGEGSVEHFESIMSSMPVWAYDWPIVAKGGWRRKRYGK